MILLLSLKGISQEFKLYSPLRTYHWNRQKEMLQEYSGTEGGNAGAVLIIDMKKDKFFQSVQVGVVRNSFGSTAYLAQYGIGKTLFSNLDVSINLGLISGYNRLYELNSDLKNILPKVMSSNGIVPSTVITLTYSKYKLQPTINISPTFINAGVMIRLSKYTK